MMVRFAAVTRWLCGCQLLTRIDDRRATELFGAARIALARDMTSSVIILDPDGLRIDLRHGADTERTSRRFCNRSSRMMSLSSSRLPKADALAGRLPVTRLW